MFGDVVVDVFFCGGGVVECCACFGECAFGVGFAVLAGALEGFVGLCGFAAGGGADDFAAVLDGVGDGCEVAFCVGDGAVDHVDGALVVVVFAAGFVKVDVEFAVCCEERGVASEWVGGGAESGVVEGLLGGVFGCGERGVIDVCVACFELVCFGDFFFDFADEGLEVVLCDVELFFGFFDGGELGVGLVEDEADAVDDVDEGALLSGWELGGSTPFFENGFEFVEFALCDCGVVFDAGEECWVDALCECG